MLPSCPGQVDFATRQVSSHFHLPNRQGPRQIVLQLNQEISKATLAQGSKIWELIVQRASLNLGFFSLTEVYIYILDNRHCIIPYFQYRVQTAMLLNSPSLSFISSLENLLTSRKHLPFQLRFSVILITGLSSGSSLERPVVDRFAISATFVLLHNCHILNNHFLNRIKYLCRQ